MKSKANKTIFITLALLLLLLLGVPFGFLSGQKQGRVLLDEKIELPFSVPSSEKVLLVYLGYVGCQTICMPSLEESAKVFSSLKEKDNIAFYFVNISQEAVGAKEFAQHFHKDFKAVQLPRKETLALMGELRAYSSEPLVTGGEIYHTGYLYLIKQEKKGDFTLKALYFTRPFDAQSIISDIQKELK